MIGASGSREVGVPGEEPPVEPRLADRLRHSVQRIASAGLGDVWVAAVAIVVAFLVVGLLIYVMGINPLAAYREMIRGSVGSKNGIAETLVRTTPLLLAGLGISIAFRCGVWNIGAEGQIFVGALGAALVGLYLPPLPAIVHLPLALLAAFAFGAVWASIAGFLKARYGANEIIITIMMNYLAAFMVGYLVSGPIKDPNALIPQPQTAKIVSAAVLPKIIPATRAHAGTLMALVAVGGVWFLMNRTSLGYEINSVGANPEAARHGGINLAATIVTSMFLSGGIVGLAGAGEVLGLQRYLTSDVSSGYGNLAIAVALFGGLGPIGVLFSALFFGALLVGGDAMQRALGVPISTLYLIQGLVIALVLARRVFRRY